MGTTEREKPVQTQEKREIISINPDLYSDLSIEELEERLEMGCYINMCGCDDLGCGIDNSGGGCTVDEPNTCTVLFCLDAG